MSTPVGIPSLKEKNQMRHVFTASVLCGLTSMSAYGSAIINGGFESGTGTDADNWNQLEIAGPPSTAVSDRDLTMPSTGLASLFLEVTGQDGGGGPVAEIQQQTLVGTITAGETYDFSFSSKGNAGPGTVPFYEVLWFDGDGSNGGGPQGSATGLQNFALGGSYAGNSSMGLLAPDGADSALVQIRLVTGAFTGATGFAYIDDVMLDVAGDPPPPPTFPTAGNTVDNPGFEFGTGPDADNWEEIAGANGTVTRDGSMPANGDQAIRIAFDNTTAPAGSAHFVQQVSDVGEVDSDEDYTLAFRAKVDSTEFTGQDIFAQIQWLDADGSDGGGVKGEFLQQLIPEGLNTDYQDFIYAGLDAPDGADSYLVRFQLSAGAVGGIANAFYVDDVYVGLNNVIPEPTSAALFGLASLGLISRRRRRA